MIRGITLSTLACLLLLLNPVGAFAAPTNEEVSQLANSLGWTTDDLENYLSDKELSLEHFDSIESLKDYLGTPITPDNLNKLLKNYNMTQEELEILLTGFNESVQDYWFIEDLDVAIDFYQNHEEQMQNLEAFLLNIGMTEDETASLYQHFKKLDKQALANNISNWKEELQAFATMDQEEQLSSANKESLLSIWKNVSKQLELTPVFYSVDDNGNRKEIVLDEFLQAPQYDTVALEIYDSNDALLVDTVISPEKLTSGFAVAAADKVVNLAELSGNLTTLYDSQLPNTASFIPLFLFAGYLCVLTGCIILLRNKSKKLYEK
ncbi:processed acidic surface protein [Niallia taxi]|uniref:processed acidic surface protein n=1 Tax=Niallia taxi TaxID=2499688 RepID=UPI002E213D4D|nr:processed acidic surface protein [Niallia taxi]MED4119885.1 processed acidic surface protein [Niallia taxi]